MGRPHAPKDNITPADATGCGRSRLGLRQGDATFGFGIILAHIKVRAGASPDMATLKASADFIIGKLSVVQPEILLGLTATPERTDAGDILHYFDGHIAVELRLWDALERGLLCPFQYFGLHDNTDLSSVTWSRKGYDASELANLYTADDARVRLPCREAKDKT